jgi:hypothetical protein
VIARLETRDGILAEMPTLTAWMVQSCFAVVPEKFARAVRSEA